MVPKEPHQGFYSDSPPHTVDILFLSIIESNYSVAEDRLLSAIAKSDYAMGRRLRDDSKDFNR
jgi:hypothetical protein